MDERVRRLWAGAEADAIGHGGVAIVARATGMAISTVRKGRDEVRAGAGPDDIVNVRRKGGGRPSLVVHPELWSALEKLIDPVARGGSESPLRWTCKSTRALAREMLRQHGIRVCDKTVAKLLRKHAYELQVPNKSVEGAQHPDRNAQFEYINAKALDCLERGLPVISVEATAKEPLGGVRSAAREPAAKAEPELPELPELISLGEFPTRALAEPVRQAADGLPGEDGLVRVDSDDETPVFAVTSIEAWWEQVGSTRHGGARELFLVAEIGGSNGPRAQAWKYELQRLADKLGVSIHVSHFPPGTSRWSNVEHRLLSFISVRVRGRPVRSYETTIQLIGNDSSDDGLLLRAGLDIRGQSTARTSFAKDLGELRIERHQFRGDWNYVIGARGDRR